MASVPEQLDEIPPGPQVVVVCRSGARSARVTGFLVDAGRDAVNLEGGMQAWAAAGFLVEGPDGGDGYVA
jgi:rhodanese-related sulfurtransferase